MEKDQEFHLQESIGAGKRKRNRELGKDDVKKKKKMHYKFSLLLAKNKN